MIQTQIAQLIDQIDRFGKENLEEILHKLIEAVQLLVAGRYRIYLEDLTHGALTCVAAAGGEVVQIKEKAFPINDEHYLIAQVYRQQQELAIEDLSQHPDDLPIDSGNQQAGASYMLPLTHQARSIGVLCLDRGEPGEFPSSEVLEQLRKLLTTITPTLNRARKYHQQLQLARRVDEAKKREAALFMMQSAANLIDQVALASVLIPLSASEEREGTLQILAAYSKESKAGQLYERERLINLSPGQSLVSRFIDRAGVIVDDSLLSPHYIQDLVSEPLQKQFLTEKLGLKSLYMVPRFDPETRRLICLVNYYTKENYDFSQFERGLLESHAEMAQRVVQEIGDEHLEVQILSEIGDLLQQAGDGLQPFLRRVLSKATQLIGADTGSIALVRKQEGERWLLVDDAQGNLIGAKHKDWLKKYIPPIRVGGVELPEDQRSLTGSVAASGKPAILPDTQDKEACNGFYLPVTDAIRSEIAVPVIYDEEVLAVICLDSRKPHYFTGEHRRILLIIERMIGHHLAMLQKVEQLTGEIDRLRQDVDYKDPSISSYRLGNIIGNSQKAQSIIETIQRITPPLCQRLAMWKQSDLHEKGEFLGLPSILITGETGSGKEFLFNNLFTQLNRIYRELLPGQGTLPLKKTNIAAYSGELTYSELFGHKRGAFTGAHTDRRGILEEAHGGVVFLDEIGDADPKTQVQLLRFLDSGEFVRLGENITRHSQALLVAGTNRDLRQLIAEGKFREDLYHRLSELIIEVPSLNERREDIPDLAVHFLGRLFQVYHRTGQGSEDAPILGPDAKQLLSQHYYTGNMRELRSILLRAMLFRSGRFIQKADIEKALQPQSGYHSPDKKEVLEQQLGKEILQRIESEEQDFWQAIYHPYSQKELTREVVLKVIEEARQKGASSMPKLARMLKACDPADKTAEERKVFFRFKNFLYKTIRIS
ncbi:GPMC system transcriptional regulator [Malonomonas rubra]|uniref:GPMC system transcriptional regulator n=1 Tax=Malonomonas rubra TaxID=57040 RepID=UPI0026E92800|nr:GPMC system transcriptional regulator [Malonomonas rubra]